MMGKRKRWILASAGLLAALAALYLGVGALDEWRHRRPLSGTIETQWERLVLRLEGFEADWDGNQWRITRNEPEPRTVWASPPGQAFLIASSETLDVQERRGSFFLSERRRRVYNRQTVDSAEESDLVATLRGRLLDGRGGAAAYQFRIEAESPHRITFRAEVEGGGVNRLYLTYVSAPGERFFGFGEQFTHMDLKGRRVPIYVSEQGIGRGREPLTTLVDLAADSGGSWHTSYCLAPQYITTAMRGAYLTNREYSVFDLRRPRQVQVSTFSNSMAGGWLTGEQPSELIESYTEVSGRMRPLPDWVHQGAVVGMQGGTARVRAVLAQLEDAGAPVGAFWLQDWVGQRKTMVGKQLWWNWRLDASHYPEWDALRGELAGKGIRVLTYVNPFLADLRGLRETDRHLYAEAEARGYLVRRKDGSPYPILNTDFSAGLVDLTNPEAREWMKEVIETEVLGTGASGWMADFGEALPHDAVLHDGDAASFHNAYPEAWARLNREVIDAQPNAGDLVFFTRSGFTESPRWSTLFWLGDQMVTWDRHDGIKSAVTGLLSGGFSGFSLNHSDIGGYTALSSPVLNYHRSPELLMRWMELNAFSAVYRTHEGIDPEANHQFYDSPESLAHFARFAKVYAAWAPYRRVLVEEAANTGMPVVRHPFLHYPQDPAAAGLDAAQFMVGEAFMVAPVLDPGRETVRLYLPAGDWTHLWQGRRHQLDQGTFVTVGAPLGEPGVFYQTGHPAGIAFAKTLADLGILQ